MDITMKKAILGANGSSFRSRRGKLQVLPEENTNKLKVAASGVDQIPSQPLAKQF